jgi:YidC/Oxa1 family membrane protein insertase
MSLHALWNTLLYEPFVNALAALVSLLPGGDVGLAVIILTLLVKIILYPLSQRAIESQAQMGLVAPEINKIKNSGASKEEQARLTFELYRKHKINPFSGCLIQIPVIIVIIALYSVFLKGVNFDASVLYSFVPEPEKIGTFFLGMVDVTTKSLPLAIIAGITQYLQAHYMPKPQEQPAGAGNTFQESFSKSMHVQMKYVFPFVVGFFAYTISGAIALYLITSNIFAIGQQIYAKKKDPLVIEALKKDEKRAN